MIKSVIIRRMMPPPKPKPNCNMGHQRRGGSVARV
jgi:hypothetical protein